VSTAHSQQCVTIDDKTLFVHLLAISVFVELKYFTSILRNFKYNKIKA
jgi:hypothetical protein